MTISRGTMGATIARLMVENAIESKETSRLLRDASHRAEEAAIEVELGHLKAANSLASAKGTIEVANSAVSVVRAGASFGETVDTEAQKADTVPRLEQGLQTEADGGGMDELSQVRLGDDGPTVGERFRPAQLEVLTDSNAVKEMYQRNLDRGMSPEEAEQATIRELESRNFSSAEARQLFQEGRDGLTTEEAAGFMWDNRLTEEQKLEKHFQEKWFDALQQITTTGLGQALDGAAQDHRETGSKARDSQGDTDAIGEEAVDLAVEHQHAIDDILTEGLTDEQDDQQHQSSST